MEVIDETVVRKTIVVQASQERCFQVFTAGFHTWWPRSHHIGKADMETAIMEPRPGGRWYERCVDGSECDWGTVLAFEPPHRVVISWHLDGTFTYHPDLSRASEVEVRFVPEGPKTTRVELEHRHLDRHGETWRDLARGVRNVDGWGGILGHFQAEVEKA